MLQMPYRTKRISFDRNEYYEIKAWIHLNIHHGYRGAVYDRDDVYTVFFHFADETKYNLFTLTWL